MKKRHTKIVLIVMSLLVAGGAVAVAAVGSNAAKQDASNEKLEALAEQNIPATAIDTDGDGIYDWEELLAGTDPTTPDKEKFDAVKELEKSDSLNQAFEPETATEKASVSLFSQFLTARGAGGTLGQKDIESFVEETSEEILSYDKTFTKNDFLVFEAESKSEIKGYLNSVAGVFLSGSEVATENELAVFIEFAQNGGSDPDDLRELGKHAGRYQEVASKLQQTSVPEAMSLLHTSLTQSAHNTSHTLRVLSEIETLDPMTFIIAAQAYNQNTSLLNQHLNELVDFASNSGIAFDSDEPFSRLKREVNK